MCGHFPEGVQTFEKRSIDGETKPEWYVRQMLGSANISGSKLMHIMTGNLSHQIEHHLFPDLPSNRYGEIAPQVQGPLRALRPRLLRAPAAAAGLLRLAQGGPAVAAQRLAGPDHRRATCPRQLKRLYQMTTGGPKVRRALQARMTQENRRATEAALAA